MRFMNEYDISRAYYRATDNDWPVREAAVRQIDILRQWADENSDGWAYWPKPARAAAQLMLLVTGDGTSAMDDRPDATPAELRKALAPVKAFRTRATRGDISRGPLPSFDIVDVPDA